jgi:hypothetical protein
MTTCLYCPSPVDSGEHLFPDWLNKVLPQDEPSITVLGQMDGQFRGWASNKAAQQEIRVVGRECNHGWMADLEGLAEPILTPMILGQPCQLTVDQQRIVAAWAYSRTVIGEHLMPRTVMIPPRHFNWLRDHREPPANAKVDWRQRWRLVRNCDEGEPAL